MSTLIITGLSGSGKSVALQALEDAGYYCIDNLPAVLLPNVADELHGGRGLDISKVAVSIDARNRVFLESLTAKLDHLDENLPDYSIIYLDADESTLLQRYSETRRRHPLTDNHTSLVEGIRLERVLLEPLALRAARRIDTSQLTPHDLRTLIGSIAVSGKSDKGPTVMFESFGYKHGTPLDADIVFDVRCLPNPYWDTSLRELSGRDPEVAEFLEQNSVVKSMMDDLTGFLSTWIPRLLEGNRSYLTVACGCTGGRHRSVYMAESLSRQFDKTQFEIMVRHRDLE